MRRLHHGHVIFSMRRLHHGHVIFSMRRLHHGHVIFSMRRLHHGHSPRTRNIQYDYMKCGHMRVWTHARMLSSPHAHVECGLTWIKKNPAVESSTWPLNSQTVQKTTQTPAHVECGLMHVLFPAPAHVECGLMHVCCP